MMVGIFGAGRNGSTLLMRLLDGSPEVWVYPLQLDYFSVLGLRSLRGKLKWAGTRVTSGIAISDWVRDGNVKAFVEWARNQIEELNEVYVTQLVDAISVNGDPLQMVRQSVRGSMRDDLIGFLRAIRSAYDDRLSSTEPLLVFKSLEVTELSRYHDVFPEMRFIHIVRNPHSNSESLKRTDMVLKRKPFWFQGGDILRTQLEARWLPHIRFILKKARLHKDRHFVVKYEELCDRPETIVGNICRWLGVATPVEPTLQTVLGGRHLKQLPISPSQEGVQTPARVVANMAETFGYQEVMTARERDLIFARTYRLARELGYFSAKDEAMLPGRFSLLLRWLVPDQWEVMNSDSKPRLVAAVLGRRVYVSTRLLFPFL